MKSDCHGSGERSEGKDFFKARILPLMQGAAARGQSSIGQWQDHLSGVNLTGLSLPREIRGEVRERNGSFAQQSSYPLLPRCAHQSRRMHSRAWAAVGSLGLRLLPLGLLCPCGMSHVQALDLFFQHRAASGRQHVSPGVIKL